MPASFPHTYTAELRWDAGAEGTLRGNAPAPLRTGPPPQFDGSPDVWSPEELLLGAIASCTMTTFFSLARRKKLEVHGYQSRAEAQLDKTREGLVFTSITVHVALEVRPGDEVVARDLLSLAHTYCIVSNALKVPVRVVPEIRVAEAA